MRIGIYQEPTGSGIGGSELMTAIMAQALVEKHSVDLIHHRPRFTREDLEKFFALDLGAVRLRYVPPDPYWIPPRSRWWRLGRDLRGWQAELSRPYDLFLNTTHGVPPFCHAPVGVLFVLFPFLDRCGSWPWNVPTPPTPKGLLLRARRAWYERLWRRRMATYQLKLAISQFAAEWTERYWGTPCQVIPPPVPAMSPAGKKADAIVTLGRFVPMKKQRELVELFRTRVADQLPGWTLACLGGLGDHEAHQAYFRAVHAIAEGGRCTLVPNADRETIQKTLQQAKVFWHGVGIGVDERIYPEQMEHFGIATVEAMAAGCVPVVMNQGGQREIVEHGRSGFLCDTLDDMADRTVQLANDPELWHRMSRAALERAACFSRERFVERILTALAPYLPG